MEKSHHLHKLVIIQLLVSIFLFSVAAQEPCPNGLCKVGEECSSSGDCGDGLYCSSCPTSFFGSRCVRSTYTNQFKLVNNSLPFNKYAYLTTHNSFAIEGEPSHIGIPRVTFNNQEDTVSQQLNNGVRALMLDTYDFDGDVWLCHSFGGKCHNYTAFEPAIDTLKEVEAFLTANTAEIVTLILEDYVQSPNGLTKVFTDAGLKKFWFPITNMPKNGSDWPRVSDMVANNQRLLVFTSNRTKEATEGIAYQWNYMVENQYGNDGMKEGSCANRGESSALDDKGKSLILMNYFPTVPIKQLACQHNSKDLFAMLLTCHQAAANRWPNFLAVDFYKRSDGGGAFQALDASNGGLLCNSEDIHSCVG
ncbi:PI-PLC X domain-containing protein At5g67130 [Momordica charantia]|uniref:PI-PLC X domain-containing protein At5g67130 n=1 Tax=Momordica charantia TaxID=3673 RepID=A0A6J1C0L7_MOMCH|nr:PI-PLC X domain-containing protein At5g67130 [Momordica charantia]